MPHFRYKVVDPSGRSMEGLTEGSTAAQITARFREEGYQINDVRPDEPSRGIPRRGGKLRWKELELFCSQLSAVIRSGIPLAPALEMLSREIRRPKTRELLEGLRKDMESGASFSDAIASREEQLPPVLVSAIRAGESTGNLAGVLAYLGEYSARQAAMRRTVMEALAYPVVVVASGLAIMMYLLLRVVPVFGDIFMDFGTRLPFLTQIWLQVSRSLADRFSMWFFVGAWAVVLILAGSKLASRTETGQVIISIIWLRLPFWGQMHRHACLGRFFRTMALLLDSKLPLPECLTLAGGAAGNVWYQRAAQDARRAVEEGHSLSEALDGTGRFDHTSCWIISNAEACGADMGEAIRARAAYHEEALQGQDKLVKIMLGPVLIVILGFLIGVMIVSLYLPIFSLSDAVAASG